MARIVWSTSAARDLARLERFLAERNPDAARKLVGTILDGIDVLAIHPQIGRPVARLGREIRERIVRFGGSAYIARYQLVGDAIRILAVRHAREASY